MVYQLCRLFNAKSIFIQIITSISKNSVKHRKIVSFQTIQFSMSTQFKSKYSVQFSKTLLFQAIQFSQTVLFQTIQFSISTQFSPI